MTVVSQTRRRPPGTPPHRRGRGAGLATAMAAVLALAAVVVGVPAALVGLGSALPVDLSGPDPSWILRPDDGRLLIGGLLLVAWACWAAMVVSVGAEVIAVVRRVPARRLPGLGALQRLAAMLVAAVTVSLASGPPALAIGSPGGPRDLAALVASIAPAAPAAGQEDPPAPPALDRAAAPAPSVAPETEAELPRVTTQRHDTLWMLAEQHLGSGERYVEIVELNRGVPQDDGRSLRDDGRVYPGWVLALPADATVDSPRPARHVVAPGDTLWDIAGDELGDPTRYPEIAAATAGDLQPDGGRLADPDVILPGWVVQLPDADAPARERARPVPEQSPDGAAPRLDRGTSRGIAAPRAGTAPMPGDAAPPSLDRSPAGAAAVVSAEPTVDGAGGDGAGGDRAGGDGAGDLPAPQPATSLQSTPELGFPLPDGGSLAAMALAGFAGELVRRRRRFQRFRRPGERMALPSPGARDLEAAARDGLSTDPSELVGRALRQLTAEIARRSEPAPDVRLVRASTSTVTLVLGAPHPVARAPFTADDERRWTLDPDLLAEEGEHAHAFPALVTVGMTEAELVLLNLEAVGTLALTGPTEAVPDILRAFAAELAFGPASAATSRTFCLQDAGIAQACDPGDIRVEPSPSRVTAALDHRMALTLARRAAWIPGTQQDGSALDEGSPADEDEAAVDDDPVEIVLADVPLGTEVPGSSGAALITSAGVARAGATLRVADRGTATLQPWGVPLVPQSLPPASAAHLVDAMRTTELPEDDDGSAEPLLSRTQPPLAPAAAHDGGPTPGDAIVLDLRERPRADEQVGPTRAAGQASAPAVPDADLGEASPRARSGAPGPELGAVTAPRILVLGEVRVANAHGRAESSRIGRLSETAAFVMLNPGTRPSDLQGALWPGRRSNPQTCRQMISRTRTWLGRTDEGQPYLMAFAESAGRLRLRPEVRSDWDDFQDLADIGLADPEDTEHLTAALALVRGRPFGSVASRELPWADLHINDMISLITDVAHTLAARHREAGREARARDAALRGLLTESESEVLEAFLAAPRR